MDKDIRDAQKYKANYISKAQDKKEESIAFFNSVNSAINLISGLISSGKIYCDNKSLESEIIYWRDWFYDEWAKRNNVVEEKEKKEILNEEI
jgi:hypothetical protein